MSRPIVLFGAGGQVGWELRRTLATLGEVIALDRHSAPLSVDLSRLDELRTVLVRLSPRLVVNAAAYTAVDAAEEEQDRAMLINAEAPAVMAAVAREIGAGLVHYSTDYVFDGTATSPQRETDATGPINVYGRTKLAGEQRIAATDVPHLIFRTSWVYGARGRNFLLTMRRLAKKGDLLEIVDDQEGSPTWSRTIAEATAQVLARTGASGEAIACWSGLYNLSASGSTSWFGFAERILGPGAKLGRVSSRAHCRPARRPSYSVLSTDKLTESFGLRMPPWQQTLDLCKQEINAANASEN